MMYDNYEEARAAIRQAAKGRSSALSEHVLNGYQGALGETLAMDVAVVGDPQAPKAMLIVSGEHGLEGLPGLRCAPGGASARTDTPSRV